MTLAQTTAHDRAHPNRSLAILGIAALSYALAQTTVIPAVGTLATDLHTTTDAATWTLTAYLVAAAVLTPIFGRLGDMFGKRKMLVLSLMLFAAGSVVSALGGTIVIVVVGRVIQGAGGGIFPLCFGIIRDEFPRERIARSIGLLSATAGIGGGLGLPLGGFITDSASYHLIFWVGAVMGMVSAAAAHFLVPESPTRTPGRVDVRGALVLAVGLAAPLIAISEAGSWGWGSARFIGLVVLGLLVLVGFVVLEKRTVSPIVSIDTLQRPPVLLTNITTLMVGFSMFAVFLLVPVIAEAPTSTGYGFGVDAARAGLLLAPGAVFMLVAGPMSGVIGTRFGNKIPLSLGAVVAAVGLGLMAAYHSNQLSIVLLNVVIFAGIGMAFAAMPNLIVDAVSQRETGEATGVNALVRSVGSSLGSQVVASILAASLIGASVLPTDTALTTSFVVSAGVALLAGLTALVIPKPSQHHRPDLVDELGAASPLGEAAMPGPTS